MALIYLICISLFAASAYGEPSQETTAERLLASKPAGWHQIYQLNTAKTRLVDFVPEQDSESDWKTKLSFESHQALVDSDPITILMGELDQTRQNCEKIDSYNLFSGMENNYPTSVRLTFCSENTFSGEGEVTISKAIQAEDYFYLIKLLHRVPAFSPDSAADSNADSSPDSNLDPDLAPDLDSNSRSNIISKEQIATWSDYFGQITVCNGSEQHPCTSPESPITDN